MSTFQGSTFTNSPELSNASIVNCLTGHELCSLLPSI